MIGGSTDLTKPTRELPVATGWPGRILAKSRLVKVARLSSDTSFTGWDCQVFWLRLFNWFWSEIRSVSFLALTLRTLFSFFSFSFSRASEGV